jgi:hypothetical protein
MLRGLVKFLPYTREAVFLLTVVRYAVGCGVCSGAAEVVANGDIDVSVASRLVVDYMAARGEIAGVVAVEVEYGRRQPDSERASVVAALPSIAEDGA